MSIQLKSFSELTDVYMNDVVLTESKKSGGDDDLGFKKAGAQKKNGPEAADGFSKKLDEKKSPTKKAEKGEKAPAVKESTTMTTKKSAFDELYERAMNEGPDSVVTPVVDDMVAADDGAAPTSDTDLPAADATAEVDPKALFAQICDLVTQLKSHYGIEDEVVGAEDEVGDGEEVAAGADIEDFPAQESVETQELPDSKGASLQSKKNNVGGVKVVKGKAETGKLEAEPEPKPLGDKKGGLQGKNNKVGGSGAQSKVGASVFES
jgi:hypothetical protein